MRALLGLMLAGLLAGAGCAASGGAECAPPAVACDDTCVNIQTDGANCGSCGNTCRADQLCQSGACADMCTGGLTACSGSCVDTRNNPENCGSCGNGCPSGQYCSGGRCTGGGCPPGQTDCSGSCADLQTDPANCGTCGNSCEGACYGGECQSSGCPAPLTDCSGRCVDTTKDEENCGSCGNGCDPGQTCSDSTCRLNCPEGLTDCSGECVQTRSDSRHCGHCDNACPAGQVCDSSTCSSSGCTSGLTDCSGSCVDTRVDPTNCGRCGNRCPSGQSCVESGCAIVCPTGQTECGGVCVSTDTDPTNCGSCSTTCRDDQVCRGTCQCPSGRQDCPPGACVDTRVDPDNCGSCGNDCSSSEACDDGTCTMDCDPPTEPCGGYCVNTGSDRNHCGECDNPCGTSETCSGGVCISGGGVAGDSCSTPIEVTGGGRFRGTTAGAGADYSGSCGGVSGGDVVFHYTLTEMTDVHMNTFGSSFDTLMYIRRDTCGSGSDIGCNDDSEHGDFFSLQSELTFQNQLPGDYYVFLDAFSSWGSGDYEFHIYFSAPSDRTGDGCGEPEWFDIADTSVTSINTSGGTCDWFWFDYRDDTRPSCIFGSGGYDTVFYFVVESTTTVTFETCGEASWDTVLDLRSACSDESAEASIECNDDGCTGSTQSSITATLDEGVYYLWIDGYSEAACGDYEILISR